MNRFSVATLTIVGVALFTAAGCTSAAESPSSSEAEAPALDDGTLAPTTVSAGGYSITASTPYLYSYEWPEGSGNLYYDVQGLGEAAGGGTASRGICLISQYGPPASCSDVGWYNAAGGYYCVNGTKWTRQSTWCAGTPATGQPTGPGGLATPLAQWFSNGSYTWSFRTIACINQTNCEVSSVVGTW
jgi:hypothetical protein